MCHRNIVDLNAVLIFCFFFILFILSLLPLVLVTCFVFSCFIFFFYFSFMFSFENRPAPFPGRMLRGLNLVYELFFSPGFVFDFLSTSREIGYKSIPEMTSLVLSGTLILKSINQSGNSCSIYIS